MARGRRRRAIDHAHKRDTAREKEAGGAAGAGEGAGAGAGASAGAGIFNAQAECGIVHGDTAHRRGINRCQLNDGKGAGAAQNQLQLVELGECSRRGAQ